MASVTEVRSKQRAVIEFLLAENQSITDIHRCLQNVYGDLAVDKSTVSRWARRLSSSQQDRANVLDLPHAGRPHTAVTPAMLEPADALIRGDRRITIKHLDLNLTFLLVVLTHLPTSWSTQRFASAGFLHA